MLAAVVVAVGIGVTLLISAISSPAPADVEGADDAGTVFSTKPLSVEQPTVGPLGDEESAEVDRAGASVAAVVAATNEILTRGDGSAVGAEEIATGFMLGELQASAQEQAVVGQRQIGDAVITSITPITVNIDADPPSMTLLVCVDVSDIDVLDAAGNSLKASLYNPGHPVPHIYGAQFLDNTWKIATHSFPEDADGTCGE